MLTCSIYMLATMARPIRAAWAFYHAASSALAGKCLDGPHQAPAPHRHGSVVAVAAAAARLWRLALEQAVICACSKGFISGCPEMNTAALRIFTASDLPSHMHPYLPEAGRQHRDAEGLSALNIDQVI